MSTDQPHTPSIDTAEACFLDGAAGEFLPEDWHAFLARVRRDAAREALDGLAEHYQASTDWIEEHGYLVAHIAQRAEVLNRKAETLAYRDTHYPEEAP